MSILSRHPERSLSKFIAESFTVGCCLYKGNKRFFVAEFQLIACLLFRNCAHFIKFHCRGHSTAHSYGIESQFVTDEVRLVYDVDVVNTAVRAEAPYCLIFRTFTFTSVLTFAPCDPSTSDRAESARLITMHSCRGQ